MKMYSVKKFNLSNWIQWLISANIVRKSDNYLTCDDLMTLIKKVEKKLIRLVSYSDEWI